MPEDEAELTHYPGPSRALHSPEHSRARTRSPPPASRRPDTDSNLNGNSNPPMRAAHEQDDASVWWCSFKRRTPQTSTPAISPDACPLCPPSAKLRIKTVADVISHCRRAHKTLPTRSDGIEIEIMQTFLAQYGYWYCNSHKRYIGVSEGKSFITRLFENYCFVLLTNRAPPQISGNRPDMRQRALFLTSRAAWRWNKMLLAKKISISSNRKFETSEPKRSRGGLQQRRVTNYRRLFPAKQLREAPGRSE